MWPFRKRQANQTIAPPAFSGAALRTFAETNLRTAPIEYWEAESDRGESIFRHFYLYIGRDGTGEFESWGQDTPQFCFEGTFHHESHSDFAIRARLLDPETDWVVVRFQYDLRVTAYDTQVLRVRFVTDDFDSLSLANAKRFSPDAKRIWPFHGEFDWNQHASHVEST